MAVTAKEAFWREHQDSLVRIRSQLSSHGKNTPAYRKSPVVQGRKTAPPAGHTHPPYGKYRRTPSPYLPKVDDYQDRGPHTPPLRGNKFEVIPPVKPRPAFARSKPDYDSWGEESDDEDDDDDDGRRGQYKPKPYPQPSPMMMGNPFAMYYPPPPKGASRNKRRRDRRTPGVRSYKDIYRDRQNHRSMTMAKNKKNKRQRGHHSMPMFGGFMPMPMMPMMMPMDDGKYKYIYGEDDSSEDDMDPVQHLNKYPEFGQYLVSNLVKELLEEEILPDTLMEALNEYDRWPYDHPAYLPTLYACEDVMTDGIKELVEDVVLEVSSDLAEQYMDGKQGQKDPLEDFLSSLLNDAVDLGVRDVVRETVLGMANQYMVDETATGIYNEIFTEELKRVIPGVLEDIQLDVIAEEFIEKEVIAPEVEEEAAVVAAELLHHYDNKITKRELREVSKRAGGQLADSLLMGYMLSVISRQGKIFTQEEHYNRHLDDMILNLAVEQYYGVQKTKDQTLDNKPLKKLHEKAVTEVALDVCLQQLTASLDEDLADVDEYERGVNEDSTYPISLSVS